MRVRASQSARIKTHLEGSGLRLEITKRRRKISVGFICPLKQSEKRLTSEEEAGAAETKVATKAVDRRTDLRNCILNLSGLS